MESPAERPSLGRRIALELRPARPLTWIGPGWATFCGALASGALSLSGQDLVRIAIAVILTDPILGAWRAAWVDTNWRAPLGAWRPTPTRSWMLVPYARLDSPAARLSQWISSRGKFWRSALWPEVGQSLSALFVSGLTALTVALVLGQTAFVITILALMLAPVETELGPQSRGRWPRALAEIGFPWLIGNAAFSAPVGESLLLAILFSLSYRGLLSLSTRREFGYALANLSQVVIVGLLIARNAPVNAGLIGIGLIAQNLWQAAARQISKFETNYLPRVQWSLLAAMLVAAVGVPH